MKKLFISILIIIVGFVALHMYDKTKPISIETIQRYDESVTEILHEEKNDVLDMNIVLYKNAQDNVCMMGLQNKKMVIASYNNQTHSQDLNIYSFSHDDQTAGIIFGENSHKQKHITYHVDSSNLNTDIAATTKTISIDPDKPYILEFIFVDGVDHMLTLQ